jgi:diguanylate cyclase (GGDEF)-like protein/putative nucleotidyltransferase with HDIG domain
MTWAELPAKLKIYIVILCSLAFFAFIFSVLGLLSKPYESGWVVLTLFVLLTVPFFLLLPSGSAAISIGDAYIMAIAMIYGVAPCIIATFLNTFALSIAKRPRAYTYKIFFNISSMVCGAWLYSTIYRSMNHGSIDPQDIVVPAAVLVTVYFITNSILTSIAISWSTGEIINKFWLRNCAPLAIDFLFSSSAAILIVLLHSYHKYAPLAAAPVVLIVWGWAKLNQTRLIEAEKHLKEQEELYLRTVESLAILVEVKDLIAYGHIKRVRVYATELARLCGITDSKELEAIRTGALLHDIGKLAIDDYILNKPGRLSKQEFEKIKMHVQAGDEILQQIRYPFPAADYVRCHHERWDGLGYPNGLKGEQIPVGGRILAIADAFDAIRYSRPYKLPININEAVEILRSQGGTVFDPNMVQLFIDNIDELDKTAAKESDSMPELSFRKSLEIADSAISDASSAFKNPVPHDFPEEMIRFADFCSSAAGQLEFEDILPIVSRRIERLIPFKTCAFFIDDGADHVRAVHVAGCFSEILKNYRLAMGKGINGWVAAYRRPMINTEPALDFQDLKDQLSSLKDTLAVPIILGDECLGTISLYREIPLSYGQTDLSVLQTIAGFVAPLISEIKNRGGQSGDFVDPITQIHWAPYLAITGQQLLASAKNDSSPASLIYLEIKNLRRISSEYGADTGNSVLRLIANCIKPELRETDILVRFGNRAFLAFLPGVREDQALGCAQRLKQQVKKQSLNLGDRSVSIECAAGSSSCPKDGTTITALLQSAQQSTLAKASKSGPAGNKVIGFNPRKH